MLNPMLKSFQEKSSVAAKYELKLSTIKIQAWIWLIGVCASMTLCSQTIACANNTVVSDWECLDYNSSRSLFELTCSFDLPNCEDCMELQNGDVFEGHGHEINISSCLEWKGVFEIDHSVSGLGNAPTIRNVRIIGGETKQDGGFLVRPWQNHFVVDSCSSTGVAKGSDSGGICGQGCSGDIRIINCSSSGDIEGVGAGAIVGAMVGTNYGRVNISYCHSTGAVVGQWSGGISGRWAGRHNGHVTITHSYSTGKIGFKDFHTALGNGGICGAASGRDDGHVTIRNCYSTGEIAGKGSGGICGQNAGNVNGEVTIEQCYTLGEISGPESGGITGRGGAMWNGHVFVANCYSRGNITGENHAGGICGAGTGRAVSGNPGGTVILTNVYESGTIIHPEASGLIGQLSNDTNHVSITMSVYNGNALGTMTGGSRDGDVDEQNSGDLRDIERKVFCSDSGNCWNTNTVWAIIPSDKFPILQFQMSRLLDKFPILQFQMSRLLATTTGIDSNGRPVLGTFVSCLHYDFSDSTFSLSCSFNWTDYFDEAEYIRLYKNEIFEGNGYEIRLYDIANWEGLIKVENQFPNAPSSLADAPVIRNVHVSGGETTIGGGFIVQSGQKHCIVNSCSSTGVIKGERSGGICGDKCSGHIRITNCSSSGDIVGGRAGGIAGDQFGSHDGRVTITHCHSTGNIGFAGLWSGGICGNRAGDSHGHVTIIHSYSTGKIGHTGSGGICGASAGIRNGHVTISHCYSIGEIAGPLCGGICGLAAGQHTGSVCIKQCYSLGEISGSGSGGITGRDTARVHGYVSITNCYSRGHITGSQYAGGICGSRTGSVGGTVILANVYASGNIQHQDACGLIGQIDGDAHQISITMSVYDGDSGDMVGDENSVDFINDKNSGKLTDILGTVYCYIDQDNKGCWDYETTWRAVEDDFPVLQGRVSFFTPSPTPSTSPSSSAMSTSTPSVTQTATNTRTVTPSPTSSNTETSTNTVTSSSTGTSTPSESGTSSPSSSPSQRPGRICTRLSVQRPGRKVVSRR